MRVRPAVVVSVLGILATAGSSLAAPPRLPVRDANQIVTVAALGGDAFDIGGKTYGPDVPLSRIEISGGQLGTEDCSYFLISPMHWTLDAGHGDTLSGQLVRASGGTFNGDPEVHLALQATGGTGRFAGWSGPGEFDALSDPGCGVDLTGKWKVKRS